MSTQPKLNSRQRELLGLLQALGGKVSNLDFQKLLFLYCQEGPSQKLYDFVPFRFGAFSFTSYADRRKLVGKGFLVDDERHWELAETGAEVEENRDWLVSAFLAKYGELRGEALVAATYRQWPYFATRSEMAESVLQGDEAALERIESARPKAGEPGLLTIGYEGKSLEAYLNDLLRAGVTLLCDVRRNPVSRKYGFSKRTLAKSADGLGIRYEHLPELGIASERRRSVKTEADLEALFHEYQGRDLPKQGEALAVIQSWLSSGERVALTCYELEPEHCHRRCVAEALERLSGEPLEAEHL